VLAFAADFRRLILAFHKILKLTQKLAPAQKPERGRIATGGVVSRRVRGHFTFNSR
jgi:hypothetical protein